MGGAEQDADWDDWEEEEKKEEDATAVLPASITSASDALDAGASEEDWGWDMAALEANVAEVEQASGAASSTAAALPGCIAAGDLSELAGNTSDEDAKLRELAAAAPSVHQSLQSNRKKTLALSALAKVVKLHLLAVRSGFATLTMDETDAVSSGQVTGEQLDGEIVALAGELRAMAGDWATSISAWTRDDSKKLEEMAGALRHSLSASGDDQDLSLFQQVVEQIFDALPDRTLRISVEWIHPATGKKISKKTEKYHKTDASESSGYLNQLVTMMADGDDAAKEVGAANTTRQPTRVPVLTDAEIFQDAKDIARDELAVNGEVVSGSIGYDAIVDHIQTQLEQLLAAEIGKSPTQFSMQLSDTLHRIAMEVLNASNRTESGGSAYEVLGRFVTNHEMDHVLIRPASAKAPPIQVDMDMGAYVSSEGFDSVNDATSWSFGVRVTLTAVTWYLVCDAADPTIELYEVKTIYRNRLAFPVGFTPFHPINHMRKDRGAVDLQLILPAAPPPSEYGEKQDYDHDVDDNHVRVTSTTFETPETQEEKAAIDFDKLL